MLFRSVELITDGMNGLIIPAGDGKALEQAMDRVLGDPDFGDRLGREAAKIQERLAPERVNGLWQAYFEKIMGGTCGRRGQHEAE